MKKRKFGVVIAAFILIVSGICLFVGGLIASGGIKAAKEALFQHEDMIGKHFHFDIDEDGWDFGFDLDEDDFDIDLDDIDVDLDITI